MHKYYNILTGVGGEACCFREVLLGINVGGVTLWGRGLSVVGDNDQNVGVDPRGFPPSGDDQDSDPKVGRYLEQRGIVGCPQGIGDQCTWDIPRQVENNSAVVGDIETYL